MALLLLTITSVTAALGLMLYSCVASVRDIIRLRRACRDYDAEIEQLALKRRVLTLGHEVRELAAKAVRS
jgi:hypothetical protein